MRRDEKNLSVLICRGCCCGSYAKHPDVDHARHLADLTAATATVPGAKVWAVDCLDSCEHSNVVVVRTNGQRRWFGEILADHDVSTLSAWLRAGAIGDTPTDLLPHIFDPDSFTPATPPMSALQGDDLLDWIVATLGDGGGWSVGVPGAVGEFDPEGAMVSAIRSTDGSGGVVTAHTPSGALRLTVSSDTRAFFVGSDDASEAAAVVVLASVAPGVDVRHRITSLGADVDAMDVDRRDDLMFDLGIGRHAASFAIRSGAPDVIELMDSVIGLDWRDALQRIGPALRAAAPHRVVRSPIARVEICSPIPESGSESPGGAHTHLLPDEFERGDDLPLGIVLPKGFTPGAVHFRRTEPPSPTHSSACLGSHTPIRADGLPVGDAFAGSLDRDP